jgi:hypothetical protein
MTEGEPSWNRNKNRRERIPSAQIVEWLRQIGLKVVTNWEANLTAARVAQNKRDVLAARITEQIRLILTSVTGGGSASRMRF